MKAFYIIPERCPLDYFEEENYEAIKEIRFFKLFPKFQSGDVTFEKKLNDEYYAEWLCGGCSRSMCGPDQCQFRYCGLGGKIVPESPGVKGYKLTRDNKRKE